MSDPRIIRVTRDRPVVIPAPRTSRKAWIVPGKPGVGLNVDAEVPTYAALPTGLTEADAGRKVRVVADGLIYMWSGTAWPAEGDGIEVRGEEGPQGRSVSSIAVAGDNLVFSMSDSTTENVPVPAIEAANAAAAAAAASASAADASAGAAADSESAAGDSAAEAHGYADDAAASAQEAADIVGAGVPNATTTTKGGVILAGDLAGTYDAPTVPALATKVDRTATASRVYATDGSGAQTTLAWSAAADASSIAQRGAGGVLVVGTPTGAAHATTKTYVDTAVAAKADAAATTAALAGKADLSGGKLLTSQVPDLAIVQYLGSVASQAAMLTLTGQQGDWCIRSDLGTVWIITGSDPSVLANWQQTAYPAAPVASVAGKTGAVTLAAGDITSGTFAIGRIPTGTSSSTVCLGNDTRLSDTRTPTDGTVTTAKLVDGAVTTGKLGAEQVTYAKMAGNSVGGYNIMDGAVGTSELADGAVTPAKMGTGRVVGQVNGVATSTVIERMTAAQYAAATKDANTVYIVT